MDWRELDAYRNLACNPYDVRGESRRFPHATSNSECRDEAVFAARNAIDGFKENRRHGGWPFQSWGPEKRKDLWWQVDFGREVEVDKRGHHAPCRFPARQALAPREYLVSLTGIATSAGEKSRPNRRFAAQDIFAETDWACFGRASGVVRLTECEVWGRDPLPIVDETVAVQAK